MVIVLPHLNVMMSKAPVCTLAIIMASSLASPPLLVKYTTCNVKSNETDRHTIG